MRAEDALGLVGGLICAFAFIGFMCALGYLADDPRQDPTRTRKPHVTVYDQDIRSMAPRLIAVSGALRASGNVFVDVGPGYAVAVPKPAPRPKSQGMTRPALWEFGGKHPGYVGRE